MTKSNAVKQKVIYLECEKYQAESFRLTPQEAVASVSPVDFMTAYQRVKEGAQCDAIVESKAFAFHWTAREAGALGKDPKHALSDPALATELFLRLMQWLEARLKWHVFLMQKECPAAFDEQQTQRARDAAELGLRLGDKSERITDRLINFIKRRNDLSDHEWRVFIETAHAKKPRGWVHPELDTFLMLMWPIVERFEWTYGDVLDAARKKFPDEQGHPFDATHQLIVHCGGLGLRSVNKPRTARPHPKGKAPLLGLVQEISTEADLLRRLGFLVK